MDTRLNILFASHTFIGSPFVVGSHHLANAMSEMGHHVFHLSTPISPAHLIKIMKGTTYKSRFKNWLSGGDIRNNVFNYVPLTFYPWNIAKKFRKVNMMYYGFVPKITYKLKQNDFNEVDLLLIDQYSFIGLEKIVKPKVAVYRATDLYSHMRNDHSIEEIEKQIVDRVDGIIGTSHPVISNLRSYNKGKPWMLMENGVDFDHFYNKKSIPDEFREIDGPKAIYIGAIDERLDLEAIKTLAIHSPKLKLILIGPFSQSERSFFSDLSNIYLLGEKKYAEIPYYLNNADVALLPLSDHPANEGRSPMKLYEYAAAGLPVVSKQTEELVRRNENFIYFYKDKKDIVSVVNELIQTKNEKQIDITESARKHSWNKKAEEIIKFANRLSDGDEHQWRSNQMISGCGNFE